MKKSLTLIIFSCLLGQILFSQNCQTGRYLHPIFSDVAVAYNIVYAQADPYDLFNLPDEINLQLDLYEPAGDTLSQRPLVLMFFGGGFVAGDKSFTDMVAWGDSLARHGYVVAAVNYRLGFNLFVGESAVRAVYRAIQDARAAVRFFKEFHETYRIDTTHIYMGGNSAGSFTALHTAFVTEETERPQATYGLNYPLSTENTDLGCLDCSGNSYNHTVEVAGVINLWGALYDTSFINPEEHIPVLHVHGTADGTVPFEYGPPFGGVLPLPPVYGSQLIHERMGNLGLYDEFFPYAGLDHAFYLSGALLNEYWEPVFNLGRDFLWHIQSFQTPAVAGATTLCVGTTVTYEIPFQDGSKYCWEVENGTVISENGNLISVTWDVPNVVGTVTVTETNYYDLSGLSSTLEVSISGYPTASFSYDINDQEVSFTNTSVGAENWHWDFSNNLTSNEEHPVQFFEPGTYLVTLSATNAAGCETTYTATIVVEPNTTEEFSDPEFALLLSPNPVSSTLNLSFNSSEKATALLDLISIHGKIIQRNEQPVFIGENKLSLNVDGVIPGVYLLRLQTGEKQRFARVIKK
ncbi:MAG: T9SS type A sorting domain-containing protein [Saprospiraceae bacterium]